MPNVMCHSCRESSEAKDCPPAMSVYHDLRCPKCDSTNLDTSEINKEWERHHQKYGYGDDNFIKRGE